MGGINVLRVYQAPVVATELPIDCVVVGRLFFLIFILLFSYLYCEIRVTWCILARSFIYHCGF